MSCNRMTSGHGCDGRASRRIAGWWESRHRSRNGGTGGKNDKEERLLSTLREDRRAGWEGLLRLFFFIEAGFCIERMRMIDILHCSHSAPASWSLWVPQAPPTLHAHILLKDFHLILAALLTFSNHHSFLSRSAVARRASLTCTMPNLASGLLQGQYVLFFAFQAPRLLCNQGTIQQKHRA